MAGPSQSADGGAPGGVRRPAVAGLFYPDQPDACAAQAKALLEEGRRENDRVGGAGIATQWIGGIVPHAGWICSGAVAAQTIDRLAASGPRVRLVVVFGAIHTPIPVDRGVLDSHQAWAIPSHRCEIMSDLRQRLSGDAAQFVTDDRFHRREHAVEVELPMIEAAWPGVRVLPIEVPPETSAIALGETVARLAREMNLEAVYLASSDLTHYGSNYRFTPAGIGPAAMRWAQENDRRLLDRIERLEPAGVIEEVERHHNACGAGAIAAMIAACGESGASRALTLRQTSSFQTLAEIEPQSPDNAVGYAAVVIG